MNLVVAIDCTRSNGDPTSPDSLHYYKESGVPNDYVLETICRFVLSVGCRMGMQWKFVFLNLYEHWYWESDLATIALTIDLAWGAIAWLIESDSRRGGLFEVSRIRTSTDELIMFNMTMRIFNLIINKYSSRSSSDSDFPCHHLNHFLMSLPNCRPTDPSSDPQNHVQLNLCNLVAPNGTSHLDWLTLDHTLDDNVQNPKQRLWFSQFLVGQKVQLYLLVHQICTSSKEESNPSGTEISGGSALKGTFVPSLSPAALSLDCSTAFVYWLVRAKGAYPKCFAINGYTMSLCRGRLKAPFRYQIVFPLLSFFWLLLCFWISYDTHFSLNWHRLYSHFD